MIEQSNDRELTKELGKWPNCHSPAYGHTGLGARQTRFRHRFWSQRERWRRRNTLSKIPVSEALQRVPVPQRASPLWTP